MSEGYPRRGSALTRRIGAFLLGLRGWHVAGELPPLPRFVLIVAPHTSNWDFPIGILAMLAINLRTTWFGKHTLFRFPFVRLLRWLGGEPIHRGTHQGAVATAIHHFRTREQWVLTLAPEGTRGHTEQWKTGFLKIAVTAAVPIVPVWFDYRTREVHLGAPITPPDDGPETLAAIRALFCPEMAKHPEQFAGD